MHGRRVIAAADAEARRQGIAPHMTVTRARMLVPDLEVADADPDADLAGLERLALWAGRRYSPCVAPDPPNGVWLDVSGCAGLFGSERALLKDLHRRVAATGVALQIAVADTPAAAHAVARHVPAGRPVTIEPGHHRRAMALLPIAALRLDLLTIEALRKLGFERIEQLIEAPRAPIAKRFGHTVYRRLDQALGHVPEPIEPLFPTRAPRSRRGLLEPIMTAEAMARVARDLVDDAITQLVQAGTGARRLDLAFHRVDGHTPMIRVGTASPTRDPAHLAKLLAARLDTIDPGLGIEAMTLIVSLVEPLGGRQADLARDGQREPDVAGLVDALANRFGGRSLYRTAPRPGGMPERTVHVVPALSGARDRQWPDDLPRPSRMLSPPQPVQVIAMLPDHPPALFVWRGKRYRVMQADGPERLQGEWWRDAGQEAEQALAVRDYFQVEVEGGGRYWLFRQGDGKRASSGPMRWFIHGAFA